MKIEKFKKFIPPLLVIILLMFPFFVAGRIVKINKITCRSQHVSCSVKIEKEVKKAERLGLFSAKKHITDELENEFLVKDFSFHYQLPDELIVSVVERNAKFAVQNPSVPWVALIDSDGYSLSLEEETALPLLTINENLPNPGERVGRKVLFALDIFTTLEKIYSVNSAKVKDGRLVIELERGINVLFPLEGDRQVLLGSFIFIYSKIKDNEEITTRLGSPEVDTIDLRFKNPVIR